MLTLNQAVQQLNNIATAHANIKSFYFGELYDFASSGSVEYPAMAVTYENATYKENALMYSFNIYIMDRVDKGLDYRTDIISDTLQMCLDVLALLDRDVDFTSKINKTLTISDFTDRFNDEVTGNWFKLDITNRYPLDLCAVPATSLTIVDELTTANDLTSLAQNLVAFWKGNGNGNDEQGSYNATTVNGATYDTGLVDQAFSLDGVNDYFSIGTDSFNYTTNFSVSAWIKKDSSSIDCIIANFSQISTINRGWAFRISAQDGLNISFWNNNIEYGLGGGVISNNVWTHVAFTYSTATGRVLYINGVNVATTSITIAPDYLTATALIGYEANVGLPFDGSIQYVRLYDKKLTDTDILNLYNSGTPI